MEHRARISLGPPAPRNDAEGGTAFMRRRAASVSGRAVRPVLVVRNECPVECLRIGPAQVYPEAAYSSPRPLGYGHRV